MSNESDNSGQGTMPTHNNEQTQSHFGSTVVSKAELDYREAQRQTPEPQYNLTPGGNTTKVVNAGHQKANEERIQYLRERLGARVNVARDNFNMSSSQAVDMQEIQSQSKGKGEGQSY